MAEKDRIGQDRTWNDGVGYLRTGPEAQERTGWTCKERDGQEKHRQGQERAGMCSEERERTRKDVI